MTQAGCKPTGELNKIIDSSAEPLSDPLHLNTPLWPSPQGISLLKKESGTYGTSDV